MSSMLEATSDATFDMVVLGGGSGGYAAALRASQLGLSVALIEKNKLGGTCLHQGCIPTKAMLHAAEVAETARGAAAYGVKAVLEGVDLGGVHAFKAGVIDRLYRGLQGLLKGSPGITVIEGEGRLVATSAGGGTIEVNGEQIQGRNLVLATGASARTLGLTIGGRVVTSDQALELAEVPKHVVIIGGSVIGVEFASIWRSFGAEVTVVEGLERLVPLEDPTLAKQLERAFRKRGITVRTGVRFTRVEERGADAVVFMDDGAQIEADLVLVAVGRAPRSLGMGFESAGIELDEDGWVVTDGRLATSAKGVFAVGDLVHGAQLAHRGFAHGIFVAEEIAGLHPAPVVDSGIPRVTYCEPEIASVGLTEPEARQRLGDDDVEVTDYSLGGNGKSQILKTAGSVRLIREKGGPIVGVHMIGARLSEQIGEASLIVNRAMLPDEVAQVIHAHPSQNEALGEAALALAGKPLHAHR